jgi:S-methylmethionine-dependent homocysteine/selenocysteine methylase
VSGPGRQRAVSELLRDDVVLLSGACGPELLRRGVPTPLPLWSTVALVDNPDRVRDVHRDYATAGARILTANTFRTNRAAFAAAGLEDRSRELTALAVRLARRAVGDLGVDAHVRRPLLIAGSMAPVRDCYRPDLVPDDTTLRLEHGLRVRDLVAARADLALCETMNSVREAVAALGACRAGALPAMVSFVCAPGARLLSGEPLADAVRAVLPFGPTAILVNCCELDVAGEALHALLAATSLPVGVYANGAGRPDDTQGWAFGGGVTKDEYVAAARGWIAAGARLVGGCCGTSPDWVAALR